MRRAQAAGALPRRGEARDHGRHVSLPGRPTASGENRENQAQAFALLKQAGYELQGRQAGRCQERPASSRSRSSPPRPRRSAAADLARDLERLGIKVKMRVVDGAQYQARLTNYDFDMIQNTWASSLSPGNEQLFRWSSSCGDDTGTYNYRRRRKPGRRRHDRGAARGEDRRRLRLRRARARPRAAVGRLRDPAVLYRPSSGSRTGRG